MTNWICKRQHQLKKKYKFVIFDDVIIIGKKNFFFLHPLKMSIWKVLYNHCFTFGVQYPCPDP